MSSPLARIRRPLTALSLVLAVGLGFASGGRIVASMRDDADPGSSSFDAGDRLGLFIGVDRYPEVLGIDLEGGGADARRLETLFRERFGFRRTTLLIDEEASRARIVEALADLEDRVARSDDSAPAWVVISFAGHAIQLPDQRGAGDEADGRDEAWLPHDATWSRRNVLRDDAIRDAVDRLLARGARVLFLSDSCHAAGLLDDLTAPGSADGAGRERLVALLACEEGTEALEFRGADGPTGRFSLTLRSVLRDIEPGAGFDELLRRVSRRFIDSWPEAEQRPHGFAGGVVAATRIEALAARP